MEEETRTVVQSNEQEAESHEAEEQHVEEHDAPQQDGQDEEPKHIPLAAHLKEKRKYQERLDQAQREKWEMEQRLARLEQAVQAPQEEEETDEYGQKIESKIYSKVKTEVLDAVEKMYIAQNPGCVDLIEEKLPEITKKRPWLLDVIKNSENRYARAMEIIEDYAPKQKPSTGAERMAKNAQKPGTPTGSGAKSGSLNEMAATKGMSMREFSQWRAKKLGRRPNIR